MAPGRADRIALLQRNAAAAACTGRTTHSADRGQPSGEAGQPGGVRREENGRRLAGALEDAHLL
jgi:hypothetical protein